MSMHQMLTMDVGELSAFQGIRSERLIRENYAPTISDGRWRKLALSFMTLDKPITTYTYPLISHWDFAAAPGSGAHHTHFGGLALHTLQNLEYAAAWTEVYAQRGIKLDKGLLYATIIIHDCMKRFIYSFDDDFNFVKAEDPFIAKREDHHSWVLRELKGRGCDRDLLASVAAIHGIDDVALDGGVKSVAIVNHYLAIGDTGLQYTKDDVRPEHVIAFLSDSDWHWSGQVQRKTGLLAERMARDAGLSRNRLMVYLGSRFSYENVGDYIEKHGYDKAAEYFTALIRG